MVISFLELILNLVEGIRTYMRKVITIQGWVDTKRPLWTILSSEAYMY